MPNYYYRSGPNEFGPLTASQLKKLAASGRLTADDEVRRGSGEWLRAALLPGIFDERPRASEVAINEMDVLTGLCPDPLSQSPPRAERETAFEAQLTKHATKQSETRPRPSTSDMASAQAGRHSTRPSLAWPRAVSALCYLSSVLGVALGAFSLFSAQNVNREILGGVCFLIAILALGCGCAVRLLADLRPTGDRHPS